jgi:hypothetical protein
MAPVPMAVRPGCSPSYRFRLPPERRLGLGHRAARFPLPLAAHTDVASPIKRRGLRLPAACSHAAMIQVQLQRDGQRQPCGRTHRLKAELQAEWSGSRRPPPTVARQEQPFEDGHLLAPTTGCPTGDLRPLKADPHGAFVEACATPGEQGTELRVHVLGARWLAAPPPLPAPAMEKLMSASPARRARAGHHGPRRRGATRPPVRPKRADVPSPASLDADQRSGSAKPHARPCARHSKTTRIRREVRSSRWVTSQIGNRTGGTSSRTRTMPGVSRAISSIMAPMPRPWRTRAQ